MLQGIVVTVTNGVAGHSQRETTDPFGIECVGRTCRSSGEKLVGPTFYAVIVTLSNGTNKGTPVVDKAIGGSQRPHHPRRAPEGLCRALPCPTRRGRAV